jgi:CheY-like chemotaxis protein
MSSPTQARTSGAERSSKKVLVVNDNAEVNDAVRVLLEMHGYEVDGHDALDCLAAGFRPHLIILDLMMPLMDGVAFRREQKRRPDVAGIPVVVMSALTNLDDATRTELDAVAFIQLPRDIDRFVEIVDVHALA